MCRTGKVRCLWMGSFLQHIYHILEISYTLIDDVSVASVDYHSKTISIAKDKNPFLCNVIHELVK